MSTVSSDTLSTGSFDGDIAIGPPETIPYELSEAIIGEAIGRHIHEWIISTIAQDKTIFFGGIGPVTYLPHRPIDHASFLQLWKPIGDIMAASWTFHSIVYRLVCTAFGIRPSEDASLVKQVYGKVCSLSLFGAAIFRGARMMSPSSWESPLLEAYGNYIIAQAESSSLFQGRMIVPLKTQIDHLRFLRRCCITDLPQEFGGFLLGDVNEALRGVVTQSPTCE